MKLLDLAMVGKLIGDITLAAINTMALNQLQDLCGNGFLLRLLLQCPIEFTVALGLLRLCLLCRYFNLVYRRRALACVRLARLCCFSFFSSTSPLLSNWSWSDFVMITYRTCLIRLPAYRHRARCTILILETAIECLGIHQALN